MEVKEDKSLNIKDKTVKDYDNEMFLLFPEIPEKDIRNIINYGLRMLNLLVIAGCDIKIMDSSGLFFLIGDLCVNPLRHFKNYLYKLICKTRYLYKRRKTEWDGYYYFAMYEKEYQEYLSQFNKRGPRRKTFNYGKVMLYRIKEECLLRNKNRTYIFRYKPPVYIGYKNYKNLITKDAELIIKRDPIKMVDLLKENRTYGY